MKHEKQCKTCHFPLSFLNGIKHQFTVKHKIFQTNLLWHYRYERKEFQKKVTTDQNIQTHLLLQINIGKIINLNCGEGYKDNNDHQSQKKFRPKSDLNWWPLVSQRSWVRILFRAEFFRPKFHSCLIKLCDHLIINNDHLCLHIYYCPHMIPCCSN